ncbi:MAG: carboxypeptidase-like regulatory domain-containing protein [Bacteroidales bacterium]|nr:carboxypeptidase-like regulatory domain-containing protein [Bacteroidales bacterium]
MKEGFDPVEEGHAQLTGTVAMEGGGQWPKDLCIALLDASNELLGVASDLSGGTYAFSNIELGSVVKFHLTTDKQAPISSHPDYVFVGSGTNPMSFTLPAQAGDDAVVTQNLTVRYTGSAPATVVGCVLDGTTGKSVDKVDVTISNGSITRSVKTQSNALSNYVGCNGSYMYQFDTIPAGTYTLEYSKTGYKPGTQNYAFSVTGPDQMVVVPAITLEKIPMTTCNYYGTLKYTDANSQEVLVSGATVTAYSDAAGTTVLGTATTDESGYWIKSLTLETGSVVYFGATGENIVVEQKTAQTVPSTSTRNQEVTIVCTPTTSPIPKVSLTLNRNTAASGTVSGAATVITSVD